MKAISVVVRNEDEFNQVKRYLGEKYLYLNWVPQMAKFETGVIMKTLKELDYSKGSVGLAERQQKAGYTLVECKDFFENLK